MGEVGGCWCTRMRGRLRWRPCAPSEWVEVGEVEVGEVGVVSGAPRREAGCAGGGAHQVSGVGELLVVGGCCLALLLLLLLFLLLLVLLLLVCVIASLRGGGAGAPRQEAARAQQ